MSSIGMQEQPTASSYNNNNFNVQHSERNSIRGIDGKQAMFFCVAFFSFHCELINNLHTTFKTTCDIQPLTKRNWLVNQVNTQIATFSQNLFQTTWVVLTAAIPVNKDHLPFLPIRLPLRLPTVNIKPKLRPIWPIPTYDRGQIGLSCKVMLFFFKLHSTLIKCLGVQYAAS